MDFFSRYHYGQKMSHVALATALFKKSTQKKGMNSSHRQQKEHLVCLNLTTELIPLMILLDVSFILKRHREVLLEYNNMN